MVALICPHCDHRWENKNHEQNPSCPECGEKVAARRNIDWEVSGSVFSKINKE